MKILIPLCFIIALSSCAGGWTEEDKKQLRDDCVWQAHTQISEAKTSKYCDCFVEQMVKTYPVFNDVTEHYQSDTVEQLKAHCRHEIGLP
jgi:hypothetical protein